jgi:hypothetical protein
MSLQGRLSSASLVCGFSLVVSFWSWSARPGGYSTALAETDQETGAELCLNLGFGFAGEKVNRILPPAERGQEFAQLSGECGCIRGSMHVSQHLVSFPA